MTSSPNDAPTLAVGETVWERCLGPGALAESEYHHGYNETLLGILRRPPRRVLEIGCAAGRLALAFKESFPGVHITGIEMSPDAASIARTRLDRVIEARMEEIDFAAEGIADGSIDTLIAGDVLEHLHDPWRALLRVRPLLSEGAQVAVSIPNVRNLQVQAMLHNEGSWRYDTHGILDITHTRFFALRDIMRMLEETGYVSVDVKCNMDPQYRELFRSNADKPSISLQLGRLRLENLAMPELQEYCTLQFIVLASPRSRTANDSVVALGAPVSIPGPTGNCEPAAPLPPEQTVWGRYLGTGVAPNPLYYNAFNPTLREILARAPRRILELGCSAGKLGEFIRELYPQAHHTGIEMNAEVAALARTRLARVIEARLEDIDFDAAGIAPASIDTFIAGDVLEHLYNPWRALQRVRPLLTDDAQVAVSLPNVRNLLIAGELHNEGTWRYTPEGLLDVTHIRFFALRDIFRMMDETGYRVSRVKSNIDARYENLVHASKGKPSASLQAGRLRLENLSEAELLEYCTLQFVVLAHPKPAAANDPGGA